MEMIYSAKPLYAVLVSLLVIPILISSRTENVREGWTFAAATLKFLIVASMAPAVLSGHTIHFTLFEVMPNLAIAFKVDSFGLLFALVSSPLWIVTSAYSIGYMRGHQEKNQTRFYVCFAIAISSVMEPVGIRPISSMAERRNRAFVPTFNTALNMARWLSTSRMKKSCSLGMESYNSKLF